MRALRGVLVGLLLVAPLTARGDDPTGTLATAVWQGSALGRTAAGDALWLHGAGGELRLELRRTANVPSGAVNFGALLGRHGEGWTVVTAPDGPGTVGAWDREWTPAAPGLGAALTALVGALANGPAAAAGPTGPWRAMPRTVSEQRLPVGDVLANGAHDAAPTFRSRLMARGRGRGGTGETLAWRWQSPEVGQAPVLQARLTGRPGRIEIRPGRAFPVVYFDPEAWVPLWPLADVLPRGAVPEKPGTGMAPGR